MTDPKRTKAVAVAISQHITKFCRAQTSFEEQVILMDMVRAALSAADATQPVRETWAKAASAAANKEPDHFVSALAGARLRGERPTTRSLAADEATMALCHLDWISSLPGVHPHRVAVIRDALLRLTAAPASGWQPIETAPKDGTQILLVVAGFKPLCGHWGEHWSKRTWWLSDPDGACFDPTHWQPLPESPALIRGEGNG